MKLHELHARSLESTMILADESVLRMLRLLRDGGQQGIVRRVINTMSEGARRDLTDAIGALARDFRSFAADFSLEQHDLDLRRVLDAELSSLWVDLQDCRPDRMKGYGQTFAPEAGALLENRIERLLARIEAIRTTLLKS